MVDLRSKNKGENVFRIVPRRIGIVPGIISEGIHPKAQVVMGRRKLFGVFRKLFRYSGN